MKSKSALLLHHQCASVPHLWLNLLAPRAKRTAGVGHEGRKPDAGGVVSFYSVVGRLPRVKKVGAGPGEPSCPTPWCPYSFSSPHSRCRAPLLSRAVSLVAPTASLSKITRP